MLHFALNHGFVAFVLGGFDEIPQLDWSELWSLPGILRAAIHASFVLLRDRLINICNDTALSNSTHTDVHLTFQGDGAFVLSAQDEHAFAGTCSVRQCCAVTQWLLRIIVILHSSAAKLNTLPYWSLLHRSESEPGQENDKTSQTQAKQENISAQLSSNPEISLIRCAQQLIFIPLQLLDPTTFTHRQRGVMMLYRKVLRAGRNYEVRITLDKKIIACQHRLSGLATRLIITVGSVGAEKHGKQGRPSPAQSPIINTTVVHQPGFKGQDMISVNGCQCETSRSLVSKAVINHNTKKLCVQRRHYCY